MQKRRPVPRCLDTPIIPRIVKPFQWHAAGLGGYRGPGYEDDWRWDITRDVDRGVALITSHLRGGPSYLSHWYTPRGLDTRNLPACMSAWEDESGAARRVLTSSVDDSVGQGERLQTGDGPSRPNEERDR